MKSTTQLMLSIGALLASEREKRGIPVEKAAKETRMRPQRLRDMENDDLSHFTNPSYARMFIIAYAKYLGIPMKTISDHLPDRGESGTEGYQYINTSTEELPSLRHNIASKPARRNTALYALAIVTLTVILFGGIGVISYVYVNADRITKNVDKEKLPALPDPTPEPASIVVIKDFVPSSLQSNGDKSEAFQEELAMAAPPTPIPPAEEVKNPAPALNVTIAPAPVPPAESEPDDHAFLLGASPDQTPAAIP